MQTALKDYGLMDLPALEEVIRAGLHTFIEVGLALNEIKARRLWALNHPSFEDYCQKEWGFGQSNAYYLINNAVIAQRLPSLPATSSHVAPLKKLGTEAAQTEAWQEATALYGDDLTAVRVDRVVRKHKFYEENHWLAEPLRDGRITVEQAEALAVKLKGLPATYTSLLRAQKEPWLVDPDVLQKIRDIEFEWPEEANAILTSGHLEGTPLPRIRLVDLVAFERRLIFEKIQKRKERAGEKQAAAAGPANIVLSGPQLSSVSTLSSDTVAMVYLFPEDMWSHEELLKRLKNLKIFMVVGTTQEEPLIRFGGNTYIKPSAVNGVKPQPIMDMIKELAPKRS